MRPNFELKLQKRLPRIHARFYCIQMNKVNVKRAIKAGFHKRVSISISRYTQTQEDVDS